MKNWFKAVKVEIRLQPDGQRELVVGIADPDGQVRYTAHHMQIGESVEDQIKGIIDTAEVFYNQRVAAAQPGKSEK